MDTKTKILESAILEAQNSSISTISTIKVAKKALTSEANVFKIYKKKNNLLIEAFMYIDNKMGDYIKEKVSLMDIDSIEKAIAFSRQVWLTYLDFFVKHYNYAVYYSAFRMSKIYTPEIADRQGGNYLYLSSMFNYIKAHENFYSTISFNLFWSFILDTTLLISKRMASKEIEYNTANIEISYHLVFDGLINILKKELVEKR